jgi:hypothetical protein
MYFKPREAMEIAGITQRQLSYWRKTDFISPEQFNNESRYSFTNIIELKLAKELRSKYSIQKLRTIIPRVINFYEKNKSQDLEILVNSDSVIFGKDLKVSEENSYLHFSVKSLADTVREMYKDKILPDNLI